jgi:hypothetical protein
LLLRIRCFTPATVSNRISANIRSPIAVVVPPRCGDERSLKGGDGYPPQIDACRTARECADHSAQETGQRGPAFCRRSKTQSTLSGGVSGKVHGCSPRDRLDWSIRVDRSLADWTTAVRQP